MFIDLLVRFFTSHRFHRFLQLWTSSQTLLNIYVVSHPTKDLPKLSYVMLSSEKRGMVLSSPLKGVTNCTHIPDALKSSVMLRNIFLPGLNSSV